MTCEIEFGRGWFNGTKLEQALNAGCAPHETPSPEARFYFRAGCKIMIDAAVRLLSLFNQLNACSRRVILDFEEGEAGTMGYLDRMGFFDHLSRTVEVLPERPVISGAEIYRGTNVRLVEIATIGSNERDEGLPYGL